ncbi:MAG TPA: hypothetical protein PKY59_13630 [Pyrinomonadaceae bacterium]|nr:hypothetical protein [Pyrinomonadaceae bacterium]
MPKIEKLLVKPFNKIKWKIKTKKKSVAETASVWKIQHLGEIYFTTFDLKIAKEKIIKSLRRITKTF